MAPPQAPWPSHLSAFSYLLNLHQEHWADQDDSYFAKALRLAQTGMGRTSPNPPVGAIVVQEGRIVGAGSHAQAGQPHAEVIALQQAGDLAHGATLYVTLEPCVHFGRTPPCHRRILQAGVKRVVVGVLDPNPIVSGKGMKALSEAGLEVDWIAHKELKRRAEALIKPFASVQEKKRPYVVVKVASTLDGRIAAELGQRTQLTGGKSGELMQRFRDAVDAVMVGANTVEIDNPLLSVRCSQDERQPMRIVVDSHLKTNPKAKVYRSDGRAVVLFSDAAPERIDAFQQAGVECMKAKGREGHVDLNHAFELLAQRGLLSVLVDGGSGLWTALLNAGLVDEVWWLTAPKVVGSAGPEAMGQLSPAAALPFGQPPQYFETVGCDFLTIFSIS